MSDAIRVDTSERQMVVRFTLPELRNPLSVSVLTELNALIDEVRSRSDIEKIIFTGNDQVFASGADLREIAEITSATASEFALRGQKLMAKIAGLSETTVAVINGFCFGGALDLALACNKRVASPNAKFAHPGAGLGIITGWGGTQRLPRLIGSASAFEMFFTASPIDATHALKIGLIDNVDEKPLEFALSERSS